MAGRPTRRMPSPLGRAPAGQDLVALVFERVNPFVDRGRRFAAARLPAAEVDARDFEEIAELAVAQLAQQAGQKRAAGLADLRMVERARARLRDTADACLAARPH